MNIPKRLEFSKQLYPEYINTNNDQFSKVSPLISYVNQTENECSVEIWSDKPFAKNKTVFRKLQNEISKFIKPLIYYKNSLIEDY